MTLGYDFFEFLRTLGCDFGMILGCDYGTTLGGIWNVTSNFGMTAFSAGIIAATNRIEVKVS